MTRICQFVIPMICILPMTRAQAARVPKSYLSICGKQVPIGFTLQAIQALYAGSACKLEHLGEIRGRDTYDIVGDIKLGPLGSIIIENGRISEVGREINVDGDGPATAFAIFYLLQDFENSANVECTISSFTNRGGADEVVIVTNGIVLDCGNRFLKLVAMDLYDGKRTIDATEILRK